MHRTTVADRAIPYIVGNWGKTGRVTTCLRGAEADVNNPTRILAICNRLA